MTPSKARRGTIVICLFSERSLRQVHPVVTRLCAPIEGTDPARLADCLGLDPSRFRGASGGGAAADAREDALVSGSAYFDDEDRFKVNCMDDAALSRQLNARSGHEANGCLSLHHGQIIGA